MNGFLKIQNSWIRTQSLVFFLFCGLLTCQAGNPRAELAGFTEFSDVDFEKLAGGEILTKKGSLMNFSRGISVQTCYISPFSTSHTISILRAWDPSSHEDLGVHIHRSIQSPAREEDFQPLNLGLDKSPIRWLVKKTLAKTPENFELQMSNSEAARIHEYVLNHAGSGESEVTDACWKKLLYTRALHFQEKGVRGIFPYQTKETSMDIASEIRSLLKEDSQVRNRFKDVLEQTPLLNEISSSPITPNYYWEMFDVKDHATLILGAHYVKQSGEAYQAVDCQYFASGGYYVYLIFREIWPVSIKGRPMSLVWRGDFLSAPSLTITRGVERMAYGSIMLQEIKKSIRFFREDLARTKE